MSSTARVASDLGYDVLIASDAVGDRDIPGAPAEELIKASHISAIASLGDLTY